MDNLQASQVEARTLAALTEEFSKVENVTLGDADANQASGRQLEAHRQDEKAAASGSQAQKNAQEGVVREGVDMPVDRAQAPKTDAQGNVVKDPKGKPIYEETEGNKVLSSSVKRAIRNVEDIADDLGDIKQRLDADHKDEKARIDWREAMSKIDYAQTKLAGEAKVAHAKNRDILESSLKDALRLQRALNRMKTYD